MEDWLTRQAKSGTSPRQPGCQDDDARHSGPGRSSDRRPLILCRITSAILVTMVIAQAFLAGAFLNGYYDALNLHLINAMALIAVALIQTAGAAAITLAGGGRRLLVHAISIPVMLIVQSMLGFSRLVGLHVPVGVLLVVGIVQFSMSVFRVPLPARGTSARPRDGEQVAA